MITIPLYWFLILTPPTPFPPQVSASASKTLPRAYVEVSVAGQVHGLPVLSASLNPRLPRNTRKFTEVPLKSSLRIKVSQPAAG